MTTFSIENYKKECWICIIMKKTIMRIIILIILRVQAITKIQVITKIQDITRTQAIARIQTDIIKVLEAVRILETVRILNLIRILDMHNTAIQIMQTTQIQIASQLTDTHM